MSVTCVDGCRVSDSGMPIALGPWADADLRGTVVAYAGDGSDHDIEPIRRLGRNVCRLAFRRLSHSVDEVRRDAIAIFLLSPSAPAASSAKREPLLGDGSVELCGKIWFVNVNAQSGRCISAVSEEDGCMFDEVERLHLGEVPAVVFNPKVQTPTVRIYERGVSHDPIEPIELVDKVVSAAEISRIINMMHDTHLRTPEAQVSGVSMWAHPQTSRAASNAEAIAQLLVKTALSIRLFNCEVRHEQKTNAGRSDLEIVQQQRDGTTVTPAELEIKVLREKNRRGRRWSDAFNEKWIRRGVRQAAGYRDVRQATAGMLCCFDMRAHDRGDDGTFATVLSYATGLNVTLHRNFLYNSSEAWRLAKYGC